MTDSPLIVWPPGEAGFTLTDAAYRDFAAAGRLRPLVAGQLRRLRRGANIVAVGAFIRNAYFDAEMPPNVLEAITAAYQAVGGSDVEFAITGVAADEPLDEFVTGPPDAYFHVKGLPRILAACRRCWGSLYTDSAIVYREIRGLDQLPVGLSIQLQPVTTLPPVLDELAGLVNTLAKAGVDAQQAVR